MIELTRVIKIKVFKTKSKSKSKSKSKQIYEVVWKWIIFEF